MAFTGIPGLGDIVAKVGIDGAAAFKGELNTLTGATLSFSNKGVAALGLYTAATTALFAAVAKGVGVAAEFESGMAKVNTILKLSGGDFDSLEKQVLDLAKTTPQSIDVLTQGLYDLASSGVGAADAQYALSQASKAAVAGVSTVDTAVRAGMAVVNSYGKSVTDLGNIYDMQFKAVELGVMSYEQYAGAIGNVLPSASRLKVDLGELHAALATMTLGGIDAQSAATFLARAFDEVSEKSGKFNAAGIEVWQTSGKMKGEFVGLESLLGQLTSKLSGMTAEQKTLFLSQLELQIQSGKAVDSLVGMYGKFGEVLDKTKNSAGAAASAYDEMNKSTTAQYGILKNQLNAELIKLGEIVLPTINSALHAITSSKILEFIGDVAKWAIDWAPIPKVIGFIKDEYTWMLEKIGILDKDLPTLNVNLLKQRDALESARAAAQDAKERGIAPLIPDMVTLNSETKTNTTLTEEQKKAIEAANKARLDYLDNIRREARDELPVLNKELEDLTGFYATIESMGGKDELGFISTETVAAVGEVRGHWKEIPPLIGEAKRNTELEKLATEEAARAAKEKKEHWQAIIGYVGNIIQLLPGMDSQMQSIARGMESAITQMVTGGPSGLISGAITAVTTAITALKNQVDEANKQELRTFEAYSKEYNALIKEVDGLTGINKESIQSLIDNFEALEQSGRLNREQLIPILRDTIRAMYDAKDAAIAERDAIKDNSIAVKDNAKVQEEISYWLEQAEKAFAEGNDEAEKYALMQMELAKSGVILVESLSDSEGVSYSVEKVEKEMKRSSPTQETYNKLLAEQAKEARSAALGMMGLNSALSTVSTKTANVRIETDKLEKEMKENSPTQEEYNAALLEMEKDAKAAALGMMGIADATQLYGNAITSTTPALESVIDVNALFAKYNVESAQSIRDQITELEALLPYLQEGSYEYQQVTDKIAALKDKLDISTAAIGSQEWITQQLKDANIETTQSIVDQIAKLEALLPYLQEGSYEYNQVKDKLSALNDKLIDTTLNVQKFGVEWDTQLRFITGQFSQFDLDVKQIADTIAQMAYFKIDLDTSGVDEAIGQSILKLEQYLGTLDPSSQAYTDAKAAIDGLKTKFAELGGVMPTELAIDTSGTKASIDQVKADISTIPADKDFGLDVAPAGDDIDSLKNTINTIPATKEFTLGITNAITKLNELNEKINLIFVGTDYSLSVSTGTIADKIQDIRDVTWLLYQDLTDTYSVKISTTDAMTAMTNLTAKWDAIYKKIYTDGVTVNLVATDAKNKLDILINQVSTLDDAAAQEHSVNVNNSQAITALQAIIDKLAQIVDKTVEVIVIETHTTMHEGGLVKHEGGIIPEMPKAHEGDLFPNETLITALKGEYVLRPAVARAFGEDRLDAFNASLNPAVLSNKALGRNQNMQTVASKKEQPVFVIHEATPKTWVEITDRKIHPRIKTTDYHSVALKAFRD